MKQKSKEKKFDPQGILYDTLKFNEDEIATMRNHFIPDNQRNKMMRRLGVNIVGGSLILLIMLLTWWLTYIFIIDFDMFDSIGLICLSMILLFMVAPPTLGTFRTFFTIYGVSRDLFANRVEIIEGCIMLRMGSAMNRYSLEIGDRIFRLDKDNFLAFRNGDPYVIYYTKHGSDIIGAEWIEGVHTTTGDLFEDHDNLPDLEDFLTDADLFPYDDVDDDASESS